MDADKHRQPDAKTSLNGIETANLCCLFGAGLVVYGAFIVHSALGFLTSGLLFIAFGVYQQRTTANRDTPRG